MTTATRKTTKTTASKDKATKAPEAKPIPAPLKAFTGPFPKFQAKHIAKAAEVTLLSKAKSKDVDGAKLSVSEVKGVPGDGPHHLPRATMLRYEGDDKGVPSGVYISSEIAKHLTPRLSFSDDLTEAIGRVKYGVTIFYLMTGDVLPLVEAEYVSKSGPQTSFALDRSREVIALAETF